MDNADCHPEELKGKFSNIKIVLLFVKCEHDTKTLAPLDLLGAASEEITAVAR